MELELQRVCFYALKFGLFQILDSENVAVVAITKVASRFVMQVAAVMLILLGLFTKFASVLATCPDPLIGGMLAISVALVCSVGFTNLQVFEAL